MTRPLIGRFRFAPRVFTKWSRPNRYRLLQYCFGNAWINLCPSGHLSLIRFNLIKTILMIIIIWNIGKPHESEHLKFNHRLLVF